ncbi:MAG: C/D box methylation guide ribonucleoprotein complex aNOP56 subunit, partial [Thaumarchaeota archaeon]|nr:C/D box methylation guide ribonucleoprotein complex aNOP56 subunit [Nitrososphaerota archaeon]
NAPGVAALAESLGMIFTQVDGPSLERRMELMTGAGLLASEEEARNLIREFAIRASEERIKEEAARLDLHAMQMVSAVDELDKVINVLAARVREWYGLHFPELDEVLQDPRLYARLVSVLGRRENFSAQRLAELGVPESKASAVEEAMRRTKGAEIRDEELALLQSLASSAYDLYQLRRRISSKLEEVMSQVAPNITSLVGATIGARLLAKAGGLDRLARMPASTIQVLGAEKALFRALRRGGRPPKHGVIFQHPAVHGAPKWQRGKIARAIAAKLAIAARMDRYSGTLDPSLKEKLDRRIQEIKEKYAKPPERTKEREREGRGGGRPGRRREGRPR